jgi:hypothetical protein
MLNYIVMMDERMVCYYPPQTKKQYQQWIKKGQPGPIKAKVHASQTKQILLTFFDGKFLIYSQIVPRAPLSVQPKIVKLLDIFMTHLKERPILVAQELFFHWDNAPVHTTTIVQDFLITHSIQLLRHPLYSPGPSTNRLLLVLAHVLAGISLDQDSLITELEGVT